MSKKNNNLEINVELFKSACEACSMWLEFDELIRKIGTRGVNLHESISETIAIYSYNYMNKSDLKRKLSGSGDAIDSSGKIFEIKATSNYNDDLTSFSPSEEFDNLLFVRFNKEKLEISIYDLNMSINDVRKINVNNTTTFHEHQLQGKRPRFSIISSIINNKNIKSLCVVNIRDFSIK